MVSLNSRERDLTVRVRKMRMILAACVLAPAMAILGACGVFGQADISSASGSALRVGVKASPPFTIRGANGHWSGITFDLWNEVATELGYDYELIEMDLASLLRAVGRGEVDVAMGALTLTSEREELMDFTHPYYTAGLSIATRAKNQQVLSQTLKRFLSPAFWRSVIALVALLLVVGIIVWVSERRKNPDQFGGNWVTGIGSGLWWSAVTMTTVGYGDKAPQSLVGKAVGIVWMFAAIIMISGFTAAIASALTVGSLDLLVTGPDDLYRVKVGTLGGSTSAGALTSRRVEFATYPSLVEGLRALEEQSIDAFVYDTPLLKYQLRIKDFPNIRVLPGSIEPQKYGLALQSGSPYREAVNRAILRTTEKDDWPGLLQKYLGY